MEIKEVYFSKKSELRKYLGLNYKKKLYYKTSTLLRYCSEKLTALDAHNKREKNEQAHDIFKEVRKRVAK